MGDSVSGLLVSLHLCTSCSLDFVVSYFIHLLIVVYEIFSAIHISPYTFSYFFPCPSHSLIYLCLFGYILVLVAFTVCGWSALNCLVAVTFLTPMSKRFPITPDFYVFGLQEYVLLICVLGLLLLFFNIAVPRVSRDYMVQCGRAPLTTPRLCENGAATCPEFTVHGF